MEKLVRLVGLVVGLALVSGSAQAIVITPDSLGGPYCTSPAFGAATCGITTQYSGGGLVFDGKVAVFSDPPNAWGGINGLGNLDLISPVNGFFVMPGTSINAVVGSLSVEIGFAAVGSLLLEVFDVNGGLLGSIPNGAALGPHGRTLATLILPGIHSFRVSGGDTWGMNQIEFDALIPAPDAEVPEPGTLLLLGSGITGLALRRRRKA